MISQRTLEFTRDYMSEQRSHLISIRNDKLDYGKVPARINKKLDMIDEALKEIGDELAYRDSMYNPFRDEQPRKRKR